MFLIPNKCVPLSRPRGCHVCPCGRGRAEVSWDPVPGPPAGRRGAAEDWPHLPTVGGLGQPGARGRQLQGMV